MLSLFWTQFWALFNKNWIVLWKHPVLNVLRCLLLPIAYGVFLAVAQLFLVKPNNYGLGTLRPIRNLAGEFDGSAVLVWVDLANGTSPSPTDIMSIVTRDFSERQLSAVRRVDSVQELAAECRPNFNGFSQCFAGLEFNGLLPGNGINYTIRADAGLLFIDVENNSDFEIRLLPLQMAVDKAIIQVTTGTEVPNIPRELPFSQETNEEQDTRIRLSYIRGLRSLLVLALFVCYIGIVYQLPGAFAGERADLSTAHLKAMGLLDSARIISWHFSVSLAYLPAWIVVSIIWHYRVFSGTNVGLILVVHLLLGLSLASWSFFTAAPFGRSPQLAAVFSTFLAIILAIVALVLNSLSTGGAVIFTIIFPPGFYIFVIRAICGFESNMIPTPLLRGDPDNNLMILPLLIAALINIFLWPWLAVLLERRLYNARNDNVRRSGFFRRRKQPVLSPPPEGVAIEIKNLEKTFVSSSFGFKKKRTTAVANLSLTVPKNGIFVLLGSNGAGKSTSLSVVAGLRGMTSGSVAFEGGLARPPRGALGIVPQKNVLFPELTCYQTIKVWAAIKKSKNSPVDEDLIQLLRDCDLGAKIHANAGSLSGGQKRKLQLAIGLVGGSDIVLVDECTSGVDPLSRRALWRTLISVREERTIIFTTHFLDEADLLADNIAVLAAPGKLVAEGTPVSLKHQHGEGYGIQVTFEKDSAPTHQENLLEELRTFSPQAYSTQLFPGTLLYRLASRESSAMRDVLEFLDSASAEYKVDTYDVIGPSIEDVFLQLMRKNDPSSEKHALDSVDTVKSESEGSVMKLTNSRPTNVWKQAATIFYKRLLVVRKSWFTPLAMLLVAVFGSCIPLVFLDNNRAPACGTPLRNATSNSIYLPTSPYLLYRSVNATGDSRILTSPPGLIDSLGPSTQTLPVLDVPDQNTFLSTISENYRNISLGGVSMDLATGDAVFAWEATQPGIGSLTLLNLISNLHLNQALNDTSPSEFPTLIQTSFGNFPLIVAGTLSALRWVAFFGATMAVFPAFAALYVSRERRTSVQAMQFSNGLSNPVGLWLGHLLFDIVPTTIASIVIVVVFAVASNQFAGLGYLWLVLFLYGIAGVLLAYCGALITSSPLAAFAAVAGYQVIIFVLYLAGYLLTLTYAKTSDADRIITTIHFAGSLSAPVTSMLRAGLVSINMFSLLCDGNSPATSSSMGEIMRYGGPILYLIIYAIVLFAVLVLTDSGSWTSLIRRKGKNHTVASHAHQSASNPESPIGSLLEVLGITKTYDKRQVVDDVSLDIPRDTIYALLGPNGAGKTTTFNIIRGDVVPDCGDVFIQGTSVITHPRLARTRLGVCPQFSAIESELTVREHLNVYGRLKGIHKKELAHNVDTLMRMTALTQYADREAENLSGGNQRKLALAIAITGNPSVVLIDEFSTGIDAKMKREMWTTLRTVAVGKAVVITTHSMEEASALANQVGIVDRLKLVEGTPKYLSSRYAQYQVHFSCRSREDLVRAQNLMSQIPGARMADDVATRFEVPVSQDGSGLRLAQLFEMLRREDGIEEYSVEKATLESIFLKVIRENRAEKL